MPLLSLKHIGPKRGTESINVIGSRSSRSTSTSEMSSSSSSGPNHGQISPCYSQTTSSSPPSSPASSSSSSTTPSMEEEETILSSLIYCIHYKDGCTWSDQLKNLKDHLNNCRHDLISCPSQCGAIIPRLTLDDHLRFDCGHRRMPCEFCHKRFAMKELIIHQNSCDYNKKSCNTIIKPSSLNLLITSKPELKKKPQTPNPRCPRRSLIEPRYEECGGCNSQILAHLLYKHQLSCEGISMSYNPSDEHPKFIPRKKLLEQQQQGCGENNMKENDYSNISSIAATTGITSCSFNEIGCKFKGQARCVEEHLAKQNGEHVNLVSNIAIKQQQQIGHLRKSLSKLTLNHTGNLIWRIKDFNSKLKDAKSREGVELISNSFYTGEYGYKIQASVFLNGNGVGEGSHISVYIKILPGEYDSMVKWPFSHPVSFTLYDQNPQVEKTLNIVEGFNPDPNWINFSRPSTEPDVLGFGFPRFVSHRTLMQGHYLDNDTLFLRIKIDTGRRISG